MGQRYFQGCKPFYVVPARTKERNSCCCRAHVEAQLLCKSCMRFRQTLKRDDDFPIFTHLTDLVNVTLCDRNEERKYHDKNCLDRKCQNCGTKKMLLSPKETNKDTDMRVRWERFEYVLIGDKRKLQLVQKETSPAEMFEYFILLLESYPAHQFRANWQNAELKNLLENLPCGHMCCVHDYSENYSCQHQDQIQSLYYGQVQVSIHVTILYRHAIKEIDNEEKTSESPKIITEHLFVISPDKTHHSHSVHNCREQVTNYLKDIGCCVETMHEWTDGCATQYKSRHCLSDISMFFEDFGFRTIRNYFETSHTKGPQDGAGANINHKCDMAVIRREVVIQSSLDLYNFAENSLREPSQSVYQSHNVRLKRQVFFHVEEILHDRSNRLFKEVKGIRSIHSVLSDKENLKISTRKLTCYCRCCLSEDYSNCLRKDYVSCWTTFQMEHEQHGRRSTRSTPVEEEESEHIYDIVFIDAVVSIASGDKGKDYYLFKITECSSTLLSREKNDWGAVYTAGSKVVKGQYFESQETSNEDGLLLFKLIERKDSIVYSATITFICKEVKLFDKENDLYTLSIEEHEDILESLNGF